MLLLNVVVKYIFFLNAWKTFQPLILTSWAIVGRLCCKTTHFTASIFMVWCYESLIMTWLWCCHLRLQIAKFNREQTTLTTIMNVNKWHVIVSCKHISWPKIDAKVLYTHYTNVIHISLLWRLFILYPPLYSELVMQSWHDLISSSHQYYFSSAS